MKCEVYYLDQPGGRFVRKDEDVAAPGHGEIRVRTAKTSICQSDVLIYEQGLPRIRRWPAIVLHEVSAYVDAIGPDVDNFSVGELVGIGCDLPCPDNDCTYCGEQGTGDWTSCPNTHATGHEFPGFARTHAVLPEWFVARGPIVRFDAGVDASHACHLEPLACCLEGMTRVNNCIENRVVVIIGAGAQGVYALQCARAMRARKIIVVNRGKMRFDRVMRDFARDNVVGIRWTGDVARDILAECKPYNEPHFVMVTAPAADAYLLATEIMGAGTVLDLHAGVKNSTGKPPIEHTLDLNNDIHYRLQCYQATHGSSMRGINLAHQYLNGHLLPGIDLMTDFSERFPASRIHDAFRRAADSDSLKVIIDWE